jgi:hypothetical protein
MHGNIRPFSVALVILGGWGCGDGGTSARKDASLDHLGGPFPQDAAMDVPGEAAVLDDRKPDGGDAPPALDSNTEAGAPEAQLLPPLERIYACGELLTDSSNLLRLWRDPFTGLPYDNLPCGDPTTPSPGINPAWGVIPQLANAKQTPFAADTDRVGTTVDWSFEDHDPDRAVPSLLFALRITLHLDDGGEAGAPNRFGGLTWGANADISRYDRIRIRYRTTSPSAAWQIKLNSGASAPVEPAHALPGSLAWTDVELVIASEFPGTDANHLNYLTFAAASAGESTEPQLWIDQVSFLSDPAHLADCSVSCGNPLPAYPDLACYEQQTGVVNIANALSFLAAAPAASFLTDDAARGDVAQILGSLEALPVAVAGTPVDGGPGTGGKWFQDWHSPTSLMPNPKNHMASVTDQPQLYAALMLVESTWPDLTARAAALRAKLDFSVLYDGSSGCPGTLHGGIDRCTGVDPTWKVTSFGDDSLLGSFLAIASGAVPVCYWSQGLAAQGCALAGSGDLPWYGAATSCANPSIPASEGGGPFLQLAGLLYLSSDAIAMGTLSLRASALNMMRTQYRFAAANDYGLAGWANASDSDACDYTTCASFTADKVTPYISAMAAADDFPEAYRMLRAFHLLGADALLFTGAHAVPLGLHDSWNQATASTSGQFLYLDTGWSVLGLLNACQGNLIRQRFAQHPVAQAGYASLASAPAPCP